MKRYVTIVNLLAVGLICFGTVAHMTADTFEELHDFAQWIEVKPHFFDRSNRGDKPHYDINAEQQALAIERGAILVSSEQIVRIAKDMR